MARYVRILGCTLTALALLAPAAGAAPVRHGTVVSAKPDTTMPRVYGGQVNAVVRVGNRVVVGGNFDTVQVRRKDGTWKSLAISNLFAFNHGTGKVYRRWRPSPNKPVQALERASRRQVFVGGAFTRIGGRKKVRLAKLWTTKTGEDTVVRRFKARAEDTVADLAVAGKRLYVGGYFKSISGVNRRAVASLSRRTGSVGKGFNLRLHTNRSKFDRPSVRALDIRPQADRMVIVGNFSKVSRKTRHQIAQVNLKRKRANGWATKRYRPDCDPKFVSYLRDVEFTPSGAYFVAVTSGGAGYTETLCDSAAAWWTKPKGRDKLRWANWTGGDSVTAVTVTDKAAYIGGHFRWLNNREGRDSPSPGAIERKGLAALRPKNGGVLGWNPGRARGVGVFALVPTSRGLWVGHDTRRIGGVDDLGHLALFPLP